MEVLGGSSGWTAAAAKIRALIAADPLLSAASRPWQRSEPPANADLYALVVIVTDDLAGDPALRRRITEIEARGLPVIPVVESVGTYPASPGIWASRAAGRCANGRSPRAGGQGRPLIKYRDRLLSHTH